MQFPFQLRKSLKEVVKLFVTLSQLFSAFDFQYMLATV